MRDECTRLCLCGGEQCGSRRRILILIAIRARPCGEFAEERVSWRLRPFRGDRATGQRRGAHCVIERRAIQKANPWRHVRAFASSARETKLVRLERRRETGIGVGERVRDAPRSDFASER